MTGTLLGYVARAKDGLSACGFMLIALLMRLWHISTPRGFVFDEVYYAKNAHSLVDHGVELQKTGAAEFIVHPPVGKWLIGVGIKIFGFNEFGWRITAAIVGTLSVGLIYYVAKRLFDTYLLSCMAALLTIFDGLHLVHSRTALLDIFLMFFILLAFYFVLLSKPWWAGFTLGLALATKWSGIYYMVAYAAFLLYVDYRQERAMENEEAIRTVLATKVWRRFLQFGLLPIFTYATTWVGWFLNPRGWDRNWSKSMINSFWHYHSEMWNFHTNLTQGHPYSANPWSWLIMGRPTSFFYASPKSCGAQTCSQEILALGTPLLWWSGLIALCITFGYWIARREWQSGLILLSLAAGYAPWFLIQKRTMFTFYAIAFEPFLILLIVYVISKFLEGERGRELSRRRLLFVYGYLVAVAINFFYFFPLYTAGVISYGAWLRHMWLPSWI
jgi:dolichyl-phosphate-mannose--protein O-mannosyl transferase